MLSNHFSYQKYNLSSNLVTPIIQKGYNIMCIFEPIQAVTALSNQHLTPIFSENNRIDSYNMC